MRKSAANKATFTSDFILSFLRRLVLPLVSPRLIALMLITVLVAPVILFNPIWITSAQKGSSSLQSAAPASAPPQSLVFLENNSKIFVKFVSSVKSANESISGFFTTPQLPEGFEMAKPVSSFSAFPSSIAGFFGFNAKSAKPVSSAPNPVSMPLPAGTVAFDFDADGKADFSRWRKSDGGWSVKKSSDNSIVSYTLGTSSSKIVPADYDNDSKADYAVFDSSSGGWTIRKSSTNTDQTLSGFGQSDDKPVVGDYDGDGKADPSLWRPSNGTWYTAQSNNSYTVVSTQFGQSGDIPVPGDYDGDGALDKAVFRPSDGYWYVLGTTSGFYGFHWGLSGDIPVPVDYDGDNKTDLAVYRGSTGMWYAYKSSGTGQYIAQTWGNYGDQPAPADYDGDGQADLAIWRPKTGNWHVYKSCNYGGTCSQGNLYKYAQFGANGDVPAEASYLKQIGSLVQGYELNAARLSPKNSTGGTDLYSRNFSWGTSMVGLPGRAGLNAGFGMSYNSLVWTKQGTNIYFDTDASNISPGFRFGFPVIEPAYYDDDKDTFSYLMVTPSGGRVEFRQLSGASDTYETADSSYVQLKTVGATNPNDPAENITITVTGTDGTKMSYEWKAGAFRCNQIKDRNGNYITINHDEYGVLRTVTDTLGRVVTVYYDGELYPTSIKQTWKDNNGQGSNVTHTWATFTYTTQEIKTNFNSTAIPNNYGPPNETVLKVLEKVTFPTETNLAGPHTVFAYNTWGQVKQITNYAADDTPLNYVKVNLPVDHNVTAQTDCPRFTETRSWVKNFNLQNNAENTEQEVVVNNSLPVSGTYSTPAGSIAAALIEVSMTGHPNNLITKSYVGASGWKESLPLATEDCVSTVCSGSDRKRWTWTDWTQDNESLSYTLNPRVKETGVGDPTNVKKTTVDYRLLPNTTISEYGLAETVKVFDSDLSTVLKKVETDYNLNSAYTSRRIIGLPSEIRSYGRESGSLNLMSKVTYTYDEGDFSDTGLEQNIPNVIYHDNTNYGSGFVTGRGNLTSMKRWNVDPANSSDFVTSSVKYNIAGAPVAQINPWDGTSTRQVKISYGDNFNDTSTSRNAYAYPTRLYDPEGNYSEVKYRFDIGTNVWAKSPDVNSSIQGKVSARIYDSAGRLQRESVFKGNQAYSNNQEHAYTRYEYPTNNVQSKVYSTVIDTDADGADADDEVLSESWTDGAGRVLKSRTPFAYSGGSTTVWSGALVEYDILGRVKRSSVPTEVDSSWNPTGADSTRGWLWTYKKYDWKGRVTRIINTDGTDGSALNDSDQLLSYEGCGCAGGEIVTVEGESVPVPGQSYSARRKQKIYSDILGRQYKTEIYNWDGTTVYTTTVNTYNGRDQITQTRQYAGTENVNNTNQSVTMTYDGHSRMKTRHYPVEDNQTETSWIYNADDSIQQVIDPRGAITSFTYNNRGLATEISYAPPANYPPANSPSYMQIPDTPTVRYSYDAVGNRVSMWDGLGPTGTNDPPSVTYEYNQLSQLTAENRYFADSLSDAPVISNEQVFRIEYTYNLKGGLASVKDPFGDQINYAHDKIGRLTAVGGTSYGTDSNPTTEYADGIQYRAFGGIKQMTYQTNDEATVSMQYDNRLRVSQYEVNSSVATNNLLKKSTFSYLADGKPQSMTDVVNSDFNRTYQYDHVGRLKYNQFGTTQSTPYLQTITYDAFSHMTGRNTVYWGDGNQFSSTYTNDRETTTGVWGTTFDAAGNMIYSGTRGDNQYQTTQFDAANRRTVFMSTSKRRTGRYSYINVYHHQLYDYDGDGRLIKKREQTNSQTQPSQTKYQIWSSVLGGYLTEVGYTGEKEKTNVYAGGAVVAEQMRRPGLNETMIDEAVWLHADPVSGSISRVSKDGTLWYRTEYEPLGNQEISPFGNEEDFPEPPNYLDGEAMNNASDPQWMCDAHRATGGHSFWGAPRHCQRAVLANGGFDDNRFRKFTQLKFGVDWKVRTPGGIAPTSKPEPWSGYASNPVPPPSIPGKGDGDDEDVTYGLPTGQPGGAEVTVKSGLIDMSETGGVEASQSIIDYRDLAIPDNFKDLIRNRLGKDCNAFIAKLIQTAAKYKMEVIPHSGGKARLVETTEPQEIYAKDGYELVDKVNNYVTTKTSAYSGSIAGGGNFGSIKTKDAGVRVVGGGIFATKSAAVNESRAQGVYNVYVSVAIHELIHLAGDNFSDQKLAYALYKLGEVKEKVPEENQQEEAAIGYWSVVWNEALKRHCGK
jgi:YD repeat-containing protein